MSFRKLFMVGVACLLLGSYVNAQGRTGKLENDTGSKMEVFDTKNNDLKSQIYGGNEIKSGNMKTFSARSFPFEILFKFKNNGYRIKVDSAEQNFKLKLKKPLLRSLKLETTKAEGNLEEASLEGY